MKFQKSKNDVVCVSAVRTPFGRFGGGMRDMDIYDLGSVPMKNALERIKLDPAKIDEVWWGNGDTSNTKDPYTPVVARQTMLKAGIPPEVPSVTFDQACISAMDAAKYGIRSILTNEAKIILTGGSTSFSTVPFLLRDIRWQGRRHSSFLVEDPLIPLGYKDYAPVAVDAGNVAVEYGVSREEQDVLAYESHMKYGKSLQRGFFKNELVPLEITKKDKKGNVLSSKTIAIDEQYRSDITIEALAKLKPVFNNPTCTAGNAPGMNDGASAQILMKRETADALSLEVLYTVVNMSSIGAAARLMAAVPAFAIKKCLDETGLNISDMKYVEINEAFAAVPLVSLKLLSNSRFLSSAYAQMVKEVALKPILDNDQAQYNALRKILNVNGGAIAIGHANTATGARLMMTAAYNLKENGGGYAACGICGGLAQGAGCIIWVE
ncbi:MAG: Acetyl-CoA acetyltransferase [Smithella sp. PtaU1.Bin162]|nr:MAG: Acetyl-CoA acetyltransferase [Smithella sp. PtaU1.Bin162]